MLIIGLGHKREVGKDLVATLLHKELSVNRPELTVMKIGFATPIYEIAHKLYGWAGMRDKIFYDENKDIKEEEALFKIDKSPRQILIEIGMMFREIYPETWLDFALNREADILIITDLRFPNEMKKIKKVGGLCVNVVRDIPQVDDPSDPDNQLNNAEWDIIISNLGTKKDLNKTVLAFANECIN